jgi:hypothetical protein
MLANKAIVLWGSTHCYPSRPGHQFAWFIKLARERTPVIIIGRYNSGRYAGRPVDTHQTGFDAMFMAINYAIQENLWDRLRRQV